MRISKLHILAGTTALSVFSAGAAQAQVAYPTAKLTGNGASSIANVLIQEANCYGGPNSQLGKNSPSPNGTTVAVPTFNYQPTSPTGTNPAYNCASQSVQPGTTVYYVSTGSGTGKSAWSFFDATKIGPNPFASSYGSNIQFAFSDSPISSTDLTNYNANAAGTYTSGVTNGAGAAIQVPLYVTPIAFAYSTSYGRLKTGSGVLSLSFNLKYKRKDGTGGLRLNKAAYCGIYNGTITNFNDPALQLLNGKQSLMDPFDSVTRWTTVGVPIRLVGRLDSSGTTNLMSRHLSAVCGTNASTYNYTGPNIYNAGADALPYDGSIDLTSFRADSPYNGTANATNGTMSLSGAVYVKGSNTIDTSNGTETAGKFMVADGSDGVAKAIDYTAADPTTTGTVVLNGKVGYVGADWVLPAVLSSSSLASADLQIGAGATYAAPTAANATAAFGTAILPPQSNSAGAYTAANTANGLRTDPLAWVESRAPSAALANPAKGYPMVGTTNLLTYTCFANVASRDALVGIVSLHFGKLTKDSTNAAIPAKLVTSTTKNSGSSVPLGLITSEGISNLPTGWIAAIYDTFFKKSTVAAEGALNLWIQDKLPTTTATLATLKSNPSCTAGDGA